MSLSRPSAIRIASQVYPTWLPKAIRKLQPKAMASKINTARANGHIPPFQFSASFQSLFSQQDTNAQNWAYKRALRHQPNFQQTRVSSNQCRTFSTTQNNPPIIEPAPSHPKPPAWSPPPFIANRPVTIIGAGVLGRRLAVIWASTGHPVNIYDTSPSALDSACTFIADNLTFFCAENDTHPGHVHFSSSVHDAVANAWMVIEAVPEDLELKVSVLGHLDRLVGYDCILATNSSCFRSRELVSEVKHRERVLNTLYYVPPGNKSVELMGCGYTPPSLIKFLKKEMEIVGLRPKIVRHESTGMILPRIWAAVKRETLMELQEGVATAEDIDELFRDFFGAKKGPCEKMDEIGLDTVAAVERHFLDAEEWRKGGKGWSHLRWLEDNFVEEGKLGNKTGHGLVVGSKKSEITKDDGVAEEVWKAHSLDLSGM